MGEVVEEDRLDGNGLGEVDIALLYDVESVYRGEIAERVIVHTTDDVGAGCGLGFRGRTAVLAYLDGGHLVTNSCSAMPLLDEGDATLALLDETFGAAGSPSPSAPSDDGPPVGLARRGAGLRRSTPARDRPDAAGQGCSLILAGRYRDRR